MFLNEVIYLMNQKQLDFFCVSVRLLGAEALMSQAALMKSMKNAQLLIIFNL